MSNETQRRVEVWQEPSLSFFSQHSSSFFWTPALVISRPLPFGVLLWVLVNSWKFPHGTCSTFRQFYAYSGQKKKPATQLISKRVLQRTFYESAPWRALKGSTQRANWRTSVFVWVGLCVVPSHYQSDLIGPSAYAVLSLHTTNHPAF